MGVEAASNQSSWDSRYHELYGFGPDDPCRSDSWISRVHPEDRARLLGHIEQLRRPDAGDIWNEEFRVRAPGQRRALDGGHRSRGARLHRPDRDA
ncbi:MAG: PAS domain-containing protein [Verrucomicrobiota bacterium]